VPTLLLCGLDYDTSEYCSSKAECFRYTCSEPLAAKSNSWSVVVFVVAAVVVVFTGLYDKIRCCQSSKSNKTEKGRFAGPRQPEP
jgi:hypothetical protein